MSDESREDTDVGPSAPAPERGRRGLVHDAQSDQWLVDKAGAGDPQAWEVLLTRHRDRIYRIALRMLGDADDAEDVTQDVSVALLSALAQFTGASTFTTWLYRIVINRCLNHHRRRRPTQPLTEADHPTVEGPEHAVEARSRVTATAAALTRLPDDLRSALVLHEMEGMSYREVATVLDVQEATVRGRIFRARRALLHEMREWS